MLKLLPAIPWQKGQVLCEQELVELHSMSQPLANLITKSSIAIGSLNQTILRSHKSHLS